MAVSDWNQANSNRSYPFIKNNSASGVPYDAILDARFFIVNPESDEVKVWLHGMEIQSDKRIFVFKTSEGTTIQFDVPNSDQIQCIWNTNSNEISGYCVFGPSTK